jgi:hypothetical protein
VLPARPSRHLLSRAPRRARLGVSPVRRENGPGIREIRSGGGTRPGITYGATDDFGFNVVENPVHVHDLNATVLHLLGLNHERLTFTYQGREFRLTDVHGQVVHDILA